MSFYTDGVRKSRRKAGPLAEKPSQIFAVLMRSGLFESHFSNHLGLKKSLDTAKAFKIPLDSDWFKTTLTKEMKVTLENFNVLGGSVGTIDALNTSIRQALTIPPFKGDPFALRIRHGHFADAYGVPIPEIIPRHFLVEREIISACGGRGVAHHIILDRPITTTTPNNFPLTHYLREIIVHFDGMNIYVNADGSFFRMTGEPPFAPLPGQTDFACIIE